MLETLETLETLVQVAVVGPAVKPLSLSSQVVVHMVIPAAQVKDLGLVRVVLRKYMGLVMLVLLVLVVQAEQQALELLQVGRVVRERLA